MGFCLLVDDGQNYAGHIDMAKDYQTYNMFDFITDESFKSWVLEPTAEGDYFWRSWIESHPEKSEEVARAREFILSVKFSKTANTVDKDALYHQIMEKSRRAVNLTASQRYSSTSRLPVILKVAVSIALVLSLSLVLYYSDKEESQPSITEAVSYQTKMTKRGEKLTLMLPDGSMVKLNSQSGLKYPTSFGTQRNVYLEGEAYFEVERDTTRPFIVTTGKVTTEVLGTSFNVNYSSGDSTVQVAVTSGKVAVTPAYTLKKSYLLPTEVLICEPEGVTKKYFDEERLLGWKDGILFFENAAMDEITSRLSAWYDVDFEIRGESRVTRKYTGKFENKSLRHVLKGISYSSNFEFSIQQHKVIIELK